MVHHDEQASLALWKAACAGDAAAAAATPTAATGTIDYNHRVNGFTALMAAAENGHAAVVAMLLSEKTAAETAAPVEPADPFATTEDGRTAFLLAVAAGRVAVLEAFYAHEERTAGPDSGGSGAAEPAAETGARSPPPATRAPATPATR